MRILSPILIASALSLVCGAARAADYQLLWFGADYALMVDVGTMRETAPGTRVAETVEIAWPGEHATGYRHRVEIDCPGGRMRTIGAWQTPITSDAAYAELDRSTPPERVQGWVAPVPGNASDRFVQYMCRPKLTVLPTHLVRGAAPSEAVRAHARQWCPDCERDGGLTEERWQAWRAAFDDMGLPRYDPTWLRTAKGLGSIAILLGIIFGAGWLMKLVRPSRPGVVQAPPFIGTVGVLGVVVGCAAFYGGFVTVLNQELYAFGLAAVFIPLGLLFIAWFFLFRVEMSDEGFTYRGGYTGRVTRWRWSDVEAVGVRDGARQVILLRMTGGRIVKISMMSEGLDEFFHRLAEAKGWSGEGPNQPVTF